ncbi:hypothetical protein LUZ61_020505 [Rhynchospora tenuis]|uniref:NB-ARC domain-containing protein n=1 Tax=Rhynchospora tenuis TaxID=198213 RepID=A0AAD5ZDE6_9POAL|nr:hypothetical protein LUZ61_020505 [Rhynchospora tenuis]
MNGVIDTVSNRIKHALRSGATKQIKKKLFKRVPILFEFEKQLRIIDNEFTIVRGQLVEGSRHVPEDELNKIGDAAKEVEKIVNSYLCFLAEADNLSGSEHNNTVEYLQSQILRVGSICLRNPQCARNEQLIQNGSEIQQNSRLTEWLMDSATGRTIISVWGTRSSSKRNLVRDVYENPKIRSSFDLYACVPVGGCYKQQQLLEKIAGELIEGDQMIEDDDLLAVIQGCLQNKKYLIILDDFEAGEVWPILDSAFLQNILGNKVVLITRFESIASLADEDHIIKMHSFTDLPDELQNCLRYCGLMPRNYSIGKKWITGLWIAEEFVKKVSHDRKTLEEAAEDYIRELFEYSHVKVVKKDIHGNIKQFMLQDYASLGAFRVKHFGVILSNSDPVELGQNISRAFIEKGNGHIKFGSNEMLQSFILFDDKATHSWIIKTLSNFESLQILCLRFTAIEVLPDTIYKLRFLRCLDLSFTMVNEIKNVVQNLILLQILDLRHTLVGRLPKNIKYLKNLRHLYAAHPSLRAIPVEGDISRLIFLQTLRKIRIKSSLIKNLKGLTELRNLFIMEVKQKFVEELFRYLSSMCHLNKLGIVMCTGEVLNMVGISIMNNLEKLYLEGRLDKSVIPTMYDRFGMLKEFCMVNSELSEDPVRGLSEMSNLVNLEIKGAYDGVQLMFCADWFPNLKKLHLSNMPKLSRVVISCGSMENLQCLRFAILSNLKEVPSGLKYLEKLEEIILIKMPDEFVQSAQVYVPHIQITTVRQ